MARAAMDGAELESYFAAMEGLADADLEPLAAHIEAGYSLDHDENGHGIAHFLMMAIKGEGPVQLKALRNTPDRRKHSDRMAEYFRNLEIGIWIEKRLAENPKLKLKTAEADAAKHFGVGTTLAGVALRDLRRQLAGDYAGFPIIDAVTLCQEFPDIKIGSPRPKRRVRA